MKYKDLQKAFGITSTSWIKAQEHWYRHGKKEGRLFECETKPFKCAEEGASCQCPNGFLHFGMKWQTWNGVWKREASFQQSIQFNTLLREIPLPGGKIDCNYQLIGDPLPG